MAQLITVPDSSATMSSREIAVLTEKHHAHVLRDIRSMLEALEDDPDLDHVRETKDSRGYTAEIALPKDLTLTLVAGYNVKLRKRIIARWLELEKGPADPMLLLNDPAAMRGLLLTYAEKVLGLEAQVAEQAPKVAFAEAVSNAENAQSVSEVAKVLGTGQNRLFCFLRAEGYLMHNNLPMQRYVDGGYFRVVERSFTTPSGEQRIATKTLVTGRGLALIQKRLARAGGALRRMS